MEELREKSYPTLLQAVHLLVLYLFIQSLVDFPLALADYYTGTDYLYNPFKKIILGIGSTLFILWYGYKNTGKKLNEIFPVKKFNPLLLILMITFFWGIHRVIDVINHKIDLIIPPPPWFWELFNKIFESDFGWFGAFFKVSILAPVIEELIFRGIIFQGLRKNYSKFTAIFMSALLFALFHLNPWQFPATFVLGLLLGWLMLRTNNILLAILGHFLNNFLVLANITWWDSIKNLGIYQLGQVQLFVIGLVISVVSVLLMWLNLKNKKS